MKKEALFCDGTEENRELCIPMNKVISNKAFDFYEVKYKLEDKPFRYHFKIRSGNEICYYNKWGAESKLVDYYDFKIVPGFTGTGIRSRWMYGNFTEEISRGSLINWITCMDLE